jgi:hypothetical protein
LTRYYLTVFFGFSELLRIAQTTKGPEWKNHSGPFVVSAPVLLLVTAFETVYTTAGIHQLVLAGIKRVRGA